jgi:nucleotide-binding universal stress UspA family protein
VQIRLEVVTITALCARSQHNIADLVIFALYFRYTQAVNTMKKILFPTDFSPSAGNALGFVKMLAQKKGAEILLLHIIQPQMGSVTQMGYVVDINLALLEEGQKALEALSKSLAEEGYSVASLCKQGFISDEINRVIEEEKVDYIVMGSHGASGILEKLVGSTAAYVMEHASCPSFIIPHNYQLKGINRIAFAHQLASPDIEHIKEALQLVHFMGVDGLDIVHVFNPEDTKLFEDKSVVHTVEKLFPEDKIRFHFISNPSVVEGLDEFITENDVDIVITASNKKTFWDRLFGSHFSKKIAIHTHIPLLVIK